MIGKVTITSSGYDPERGRLNYDPTLEKDYKMEPLTLAEYDSKDSTPPDYVPRIRAALKHREELIALCLQLKFQGTLRNHHILDQVVACAEREKSPVQKAAEKGFYGDGK